MPELVELTLEMSSESDMKKLFRLNLPRLRTLRLEGGFHYPLDVLGKNETMASLESLHIVPHMFDFDSEEAYISTAGFKKMCKSNYLTSLRELTLQATSFGDEGVEALVAAPFFPQLQRLDLAHGAITIQGLEVLAAQDLSRFKSLSLSGNYIEGAEKVAKAIAKQVEGLNSGISTTTTTPTILPTSTRSGVWSDQRCGR